MRYLFFDTETTGLIPKGANAIQDAYQFPRIVEIGAILTDESKEIARFETLIRTDVPIHPKALETHGITEEMAAKGMSQLAALRAFSSLVYACDVLVCHNVSYDRQLVMATLERLGAAEFLTYFRNLPTICTKEETTDYCKIPGNYGNYKWPKLEELYPMLFGKELVQDHRAMSDVVATKECFFKLIELGVITPENFIK